MTDSLLPLGGLQPGARGTIREIHSAVDSAQDDSAHPDYDMAERLRELGFEEGLAFEVLHEAPMGRDPMAVRVGAMVVALRRREANLIMVTSS